MDPHLPSKKALSKYVFLTSILWLVFFSIKVQAQGFEGYYRYPNIHNNTIIFTAEGDLWKVSIQGGLAQKITSHLEEEIAPAISPDGKLVAYSASYEGPTEVYTIPIDGGIPTRWTYESDFSLVNGWTPNQELVYDTRAYSTLPNRQLVAINLTSKEKKLGKNIIYNRKCQVFFQHYLQEKRTINICNIN